VETADRRANNLCLSDRQRLDDLERRVNYLWWGLPLCLAICLVLTAISAWRLFG